jgi:hypothetical protein
VARFERESYYFKVGTTLPVYSKMTACLATLFK